MWIVRVRLDHGYAENRNPLRMRAALRSGGNRGTLGIGAPRYTDDRTRSDDDGQSQASR
jgi:hypothetical protein